MKTFKKKMNKDKKGKNQFERINSQFKLFDPNSCIFMMMAQFAVSNLFSIKTD